MQPQQPQPPYGAGGYPVGGYPAAVPARRPTAFTPSDFVVIGAGLLMVVASFLTWVDLGAIRDELTRQGAATTGAENLNAWGKGLFPPVTLIALAGLVLAVEGVLSGLGTVSLPAFLHFTKAQFRLVFAVPALLLNLAYWLNNIGQDGIPANLQPTRGLGFYLSLVGCVAAVASGVLAAKEGSTAHGAWNRGGAGLPGPYGYGATGYTPPGPATAPYPAAAGVPGAPGAPAPAGFVPAAPSGAPVVGAPPAGPGGGGAPPTVIGTAEVAGATEEYWFYVEAPQSLFAVGDTTRVLNVLQPGQWYLAKGGDATWVRAADDQGQEGWVAASAVRRQAT